MTVTDRNRLIGATDSSITTMRPSQTNINIPLPNKDMYQLVKEKITKMESNSEYLQRISMLESFKNLENITFVMTIPPYKLFNQKDYLKKCEIRRIQAERNPSINPESSSDEEVERDLMDEILADRGIEINEEEEKCWGPDTNGRYQSKSRAEQINMAYAIRTMDFVWLRTVAFNANVNSIRDMHYNYALFKHVFLWLLDAASPEKPDIDEAIASMIGKMHTVDQMFYHWGWYMFPMVLNHYNHPTTLIRFLKNHSLCINEIIHRWNGMEDDYVRISLARRPRPIMQLLFRFASFYK